MPFELRVPEAGELAAFLQPINTAFANPEPTAESLEDAAVLWEPDRSIGAVDGGQWVGGAGAYTFELTVPGGATLPAAGVTMVGVLPTHRRQGILSALMAQQLADVAQRGEPLAVLTASETSIYGRFGYGLATVMAATEIESAHGAFVAPLADPGRCRLLRQDSFAGPFGVAYDRWRRTSPGAVTRQRGFWDLLGRDRPGNRQGASPMFYLVHEDAQGEPDGLCTYRIKEDWPDRVAASTVVVSDLFGATPEVEAAIWQYLFAVDLTSRVHASGRPVDDPIRWRLVDPRRLRTRVLTDWLWVRVLDVPAALGGRSYAGPGSIVFDVVDEFVPATAGRYLLTSEADGDRMAGWCQRTDRPADLALDVRDLGAAYLGGVTFARLADAGRVTELADGALARADALFAAARAPFCGTMF